MFFRQKEKEFPDLPGKPYAGYKGEYKKSKNVNDRSPF